MATVTIYRTSYCPYCDMAERLFKSLDVDYEKIDVTGDDAARASLVERTGGKRTVPQIFIGETSIGGFTDAQALADKGELQKMLDAARGI
jgi:glutaredoxin 3